MAEEDRRDTQQEPKEDEEVIVIEDEEEAEPEAVEEHEKTLEEKSEPEEEILKEEPEETKRKPKWLIYAVVAVVAVVAAAAFLLFHKKPQPKKLVKHVVHKTVKPKPKKKKILPQAYNPIVDVHFINAIRLQERGEYKKALEQLKKATFDLYISYYGIGYIYLKMGNIKKAKEYLFDKTKRYLLLAIHNNPDYVNGYVNLFRIYMAQKEYGKAKQMIELLQKTQIDNKDVQLMKVYYNYVVDNDTSKLFEMLSNYPHSPLLLSLAGDYYLKLGNTRVALNYMKQALSYYPMGSVFYNTSLVETQNGNYRVAMNTIPKMYYMDMNKISCKNFLAFFLLFRANKFDAAYRFLSLNGDNNTVCFEHFKIIPEVRSPLTIESYSYRMDFNYMLAAEILNMYLKPVNLLPNKATPQIKLGFLYQQLGLPEKSANEFEKAAHFSEAVLLSEYANKFYIQGDYKTALMYYKSALSKVPTNPLLTYNVAIMSLKNHDVGTAKTLLIRLINTYQQFPLPYLAMFIVKEIEGKHMDAIKYLNSFSQRVKSLDEDAQKKLQYLTIFSDYIIDRENFDQNRIKKLGDYEKKVFLLFEAALNQDVDYLFIQRDFERSMHLYWNPKSLVTLCNYFYENYHNDFLRRLMATMYLMNNEPKKAYEAMYDINVYSAGDYYKLGVAYLLAGYPDVADNFFTKSILKGVNFYNSYVAKAIIQASKKSLVGIKYYLKIILKKQQNLAWLNTDVYLTYKIELK